ncbi:MAG: XRE family transcriptional regulator [Bacteroidia bacterium]|jgi:transcriptional regulator with XRE-family HTH domain
MSKISKNIRILRDLKKLSQEQLAEALGINRSRLGAYEEARNEPPIELLIRLSTYFQISIDALVRGDLSKTTPDTLIKIGKNRTLFPITVDKDGNDLIEVVPLKASAGYLNGYADPQFIEELPVMNLPFKIVGKHRAFGIKGDSMPPLRDGSIAVGRYVESLSEIKDGQTFIVLTKNDGIVYKRLYRTNKKGSSEFEFHSDNPAYSPYNIPAEEILEVWSFICSLNIGDSKPQDLNIDSVIRFLQSYRVEMGK